MKKVSIALLALIATTSPVHADCSNEFSKASFSEQMVELSASDLSNEIANLGTYTGMDDHIKLVLTADDAREKLLYCLDHTDDKGITAEELYNFNTKVRHNVETSKKLMKSIMGIK
jgi:hypothetical protein